MRALPAAVLAVVAVAAVLLLRDAPPTITTHGVRLELADGVREADGGLRAGGATLTVRPLELPPYTGDVDGVLPVYATNRAAAPPRAEGRTQVNGAPGYELTYAGGADVYVVPDPTARTGVVIALRGRELRPLRLVLRSLEFRGGG